MADKVIVNIDVIDNRQLVEDPDGDLALHDIRSDTYYKPMTPQQIVKALRELDRDDLYHVIRLLKEIF